MIKKICPDLFLRVYLPGDEGAILSSWKKIFKKELSVEEWRWKFLGCPGGCKILLCFNESGEVAVHYAGQMYRAVLDDGQEIWALHLVDIFSLPEYRWIFPGKYGLFVEVAKYFLKTFLEDFPVEEGYALQVEGPKASFHYGFPGKRHFLLGEKVLFYRRFSAGTVYLRKIATPNLDIRTKMIKNFGSFEKLSPEEVDALWQKFWKKWRWFSVIKDWSFFHWRYLSHPRKNYRIFVQRGGFLKKRIEGWLAAAPPDEGRDTYKILDFVALSPSILEKLLKKVLHSFKEKDIEVWLPGNHPWLNVFENIGFKREKEPLGFIAAGRFDKNKFSPEKADHFVWGFGEADLF